MCMTIRTIFINPVVIFQGINGIEKTRFSIIPCEKTAFLLFSNEISIVATYGISV